MKNKDDKKSNLDEFIEEFADEWEVKENQYVLIENKGTMAEMALNAYNTEIEAFRAKKKSRSKIDIVKAKVRYVSLFGVRILHKYEVKE